MSEPSSEDVVQEYFCSTLLAYGRIVVRTFLVFPDLMDLGSDESSELDLVKEHDVFDSVSFEEIAKMPEIVVW